MPTTGISGFYHAERSVLHDEGGGLVDVAVITIRDNTREPLARRLAAALMHITHPNVEPLLQMDCPGQRGLRLFMRLADGGDLRAYLAANPGADVLAIARMIAHAVRHLHTSMPRVVHGNLDLSSVLMRGNTPRLWNFSHCRFDPAPATGPLVDLAPATGDREGVITAIAPELYSTGLVTPASDVYAFGILLFELFARRRPFPSVTRLGAATLLYEGQRPSRDEIPVGPRGDAVWAIITRCWSQDPAQRPTMAQVDAALHLVS